MDPSGVEDVEMQEVDPFLEDMPIPEEPVPEVTVHQTSQDIFEGKFDDTESDQIRTNKTQSQNDQQQAISDTESSVEFIGYGNNRSCSSPLMFSQYVDDDEDATQSQIFFQEGDTESSVELIGYGNNRSCSSPLMFSQYPDDDEDATQSQIFFQEGMMESNNSNADRTVVNVNMRSCTSPLMFDDEMQDEYNENQKTLTGTSAVAEASTIQKPSEGPIHLISDLKERGVCEQSINALCDSGFDTVESFMFASSNDKFEVPGLDDRSQLEIEAVAKALVPDFGYTQATQVHRGGKSPDIFTGEYPDDPIRSPSRTTAPTRRIHLITELEIPSPEIQQVLIKNGYVSAESILTSTLREVMTSTKLSKSVVVQLQDSAREIVPDFGYTQTMALVRRKTETALITTGSAKIDLLLRGGIATGFVTQILGASGTGKTQLCHTMAVTCQIPRSKGGADGKCMYLDTNNTFRTERLVSIAYFHKLNPATVLENIAYAHIRTTGQQFILLQQAPSLLCSGGYSLLIVDDLISLYKEEYSNASEISARQIQLIQFLKSLLNLANHYGVAVVFVNQVVRQLDPRKPLHGENIPAGGQCVSTVSDTRLLLTKGPRGCRVAAIYDPDDQQDETATFLITGNGIEDVE